MFRNDPQVLTFSIHGANEYPPYRSPSNLDIAPPDGTQDDARLEAWQMHLPGLLSRLQPESVPDVGGVNPLRDDRLGRLHHSVKGLQRRDVFVLGLCREQDIPAVVTFAGDYAAGIFVVVEAPCHTDSVARTTR